MIRKCNGTGACAQFLVFASEKKECEIKLIFKSRCMLNL